jgi:hypothetical protein
VDAEHNRQNRQPSPPVLGGGGSRARPTEAIVGRFLQTRRICCGNVPAVVS